MMSSGWSSWNGEPHTVERMGRMLSVDHLLIGVVGGMQPDKLVASFEGDHDGKYARVLFAWPDEPGWLGLNNDAAEIDADIHNIISRILTLAEFTQEGRLFLTPSVSTRGCERSLRSLRSLRTGRKARLRAGNGNGSPKRPPMCCGLLIP